MPNDNHTNNNDTTIQHTVVLFHGLCSSPLEVSFTAANLKKQGYEVLTPTFDGYAFGTPSATAEKWKESAINFVKELSLKSSNKISVGGISMGAILAMAVAQELTDLYGLILLSPTLIVDGWAVPWYRFLTPLGILLGLGNKINYSEAEPYGVKNTQMRAYIKRQLENQKISAAGGVSFTLKHLHEGDRPILRRLKPIR